MRLTGLLVVLKLDHDPHNSRRLALAEMVRRAERANVVIEALQERKSASGRGWHRVVWLRPRAALSASQIVALQLLFGSDPLREAYNFNRADMVDAGAVPRYWTNGDAWNVLYASPHAWRKVEAKVLAAHRERNGARAPSTARDRKKG